MALGQPLTGDYELFMYTFAAGTTAAYPSTTPGLGDTMYAGSGDDTIIAGSADDTIEAQPQDTIVYGSGTVNMLAAAPALNVSAGINQTVDEGTSVTLTGSFVDPVRRYHLLTTGTWSRPPASRSPTGPAPPSRSPRATPEPTR